MTNVEKTMDEYTIHCTEEQTKKALELGAPINEAMSRYNARSAIQDVESGKKTLEDYAIRGIALVNDKYLKKALNIPTAEEMIGWLEDRGLNINIAYNPFDEVKIIVTECSGYKEIANIKWNKSRKEATLAAIDAALDYLETFKSK